MADPVTIGTTAYGIGRGLAGLFGGQEDGVSRDQRYFESQLTRWQRSQVKSLVEWMKATFGDRVAMEAERLLSMRLQNEEYQQEMERERESWDQRKQLSAKAGELYDAPGFDPYQNWENMQGAMAPGLNRITASFQKRGMGGAPGELQAQSRYYQDQAAGYLGPATERSYQYDIEKKLAALRAQSELSRYRY